MSKHGLFIDKWFECPLGCGIGVYIDGDEAPCIICGRRWTIYNFPNGEEFPPNGEETFEEVDPSARVDGLDDQPHRTRDRGVSDT